VKRCLLPGHWGERERCRVSSLRLSLRGQEGSGRGGAHSQISREVTNCFPRGLARSARPAKETYCGGVSLSLSVSLSRSPLSWRWCRCTLGFREEEEEEEEEDSVYSKCILNAFEEE